MAVKDLAAKLQCGGLNVSRGSVYALEGRTRCITDYEVCLISRALGVHLECLFMSTADLSAYLLNRRPKQDLIAESPLES